MCGGDLGRSKRIVAPEKEGEKRQKEKVHHSANERPEKKTELALKADGRGEGITRETRRR